MPMAVVKVKQWTVGTRIKFTVVDSSAVAVDLTTATIRLHLRNKLSDDDATASLDVLCSTSGVTPSAGECYYDWVATNLDVQGLYYGWLHIVDGSKTFGNAEPMRIEITAAPQPA